MKKLFPLALALACASLLSGCSLNRVAANAAGGMIGSGMPAFLSDPDTQTARDSMLAVVKTVEAVHLNDPENTQLLSALAQGYCGYAFMFLEDGEPARAAAMYARGARFAQDWLALSGLVSGGVISVEKTEKKDVPALFWSAFCRSGSLQLNMDNPAALAELPEISRAADRLVDLDPSFYYGGPHLLRASLYASRPKMLGGDTEKARAEFELALAAPHGNVFLPNKYMYAKTYGAQALDEALFDRMIEEILAQEDGLPEQALINAAVKQKAVKLKEKRNELF